MGKESNISWTCSTWNIARGCHKVDKDCLYCYMYRDSFDGSRYNPREVIRTKTVFDLPLRIKKPSLIFASSLTDFFHPDIDSYRDECWNIIRRCPQHTFQILTKRPERINSLLPKDWGDGYKNVWLGTSIGHNAASHRIIELCHVPAVCRFISFEPLWERIELDINLFSERITKHLKSSEITKALELIDWAIIGGESGNENGKYKYRPCYVEWMENMIMQLKKYDVAVFVKQMGTYLSKELNMSDRHGTKIAEFPKQLQIREFPKIYKHDTI